ncbi:membrane protein insertase YidC [Glycocaulis abyssi]|uniref:membrane protein insertase YidC n=1 Tax=Glycocaulis abyssi TaxID=1433403 RepID=UPI00352B3249
MGEPRNILLIVAIVLAIFIPYQLFIVEPMMAEQRAAQEAAVEAETGEAAPGDETPGAFGGEETPAALGGFTSREDALARSERITVRTPALEGSIALNGARFDDLRLLRYDLAVGSEEPVTLLSPQGSRGAHYAVDGWTGAAGAPSGLPGPSTRWQVVGNTTLTPTSPVTLEHAAGDLTFRRVISVDEDYLFTVTDTVTNNGAQSVSLSRFGLVRQEGIPDNITNFFILHEGPIGVVGASLMDRKYNGLERDGSMERTGAGGWMGITSKYWLTAVAPSDDGEIRARFEARPSGGQTIFESSYVRTADTIAPGSSITSVSHVYAGSKSVPILQRYQDEQGIPRLDMAVDWGNFWFFTRPFFWLLHTFYQWTGNFGVAILLLTVLIKIPLFPLNNRAFASMAKMRAVGPKMTEIRERFAADKQRQSQEMMELYKREKINPLAGCLPILPQIPIFFALYKTVFVSLEARHAPFFGWIQDLSAPDPTAVWNLFGLLPYSVEGWWLLGDYTLGVWPILMGLTMWAQQSLNPPPPDPMQRRIFALLPIVFTFILSPFAAALVIYWTWNNFLTILQQYVIMRRHGTYTEVDKIAARLHSRVTGKPVPEFALPGAAPGLTPAAAKPANDVKPAKGKAKGAKDDSTPVDVTEQVESSVAEADKPAPKPATPGRRTTSNPAAKKPKGARKAPAKKPAAKRPGTRRTPPARPEGED